MVNIHNILYHISVCTQMYPVSTDRPSKLDEVAKLPPALSQAEEFLLHISQATTNGYSAHLNEVKPEATVLPETNIFAPKNDGFQ